MRSKDRVTSETGTPPVGGPVRTPVALRLGVRSRRLLLGLTASERRVYVLLSISATSFSTKASRGTLPSFPFFRLRTETARFSTSWRPSTSM